MSIAEQINVLGDFCGARDINFLTSEELAKAYDLQQVDVMVLFGGSILVGGEVLAEAMLNKIAKHYVVVGGAGHTTEALRNQFSKIYDDVDVKDRPEAEIFNEYIKRRYNLSADYLECESTNCGNNITYMLKLFDEHNIDYKSVILSQDSTMQRRMWAGLKKYRPEILAINYATYKAKVVEEDSILTYSEEILGMWNVDRYVNLLLGEILRLADDVNGYGPQGKNFIAHVSIPKGVRSAFEEVSKLYDVRKAKP